MKLLTINSDMGDRAGAMLGDDVLDLEAAAGILGQTLPADTILGLIVGGDSALDGVRRLLDAASGKTDDLRGEGALLAADAIRYRPPITRPGFILSVGMNYAKHLEEMNTPIPTEPAAFVKIPTSLTGHGEPILPPPGHGDMIDYEGELTFVIGKECHKVSEEDALDYVAGYTIANDVSARDWVAPIFTAEGRMGPIHAWEKNILGKQYPSFTPLGPVMVTKDEIADPSNLHLTTTLDGEVMQDTMTELVFSIPQLIAYYSQWYRLMPGDVVTTGSPSGVGFGRDPKVFMKPGQRVEITIEGIGTLSNPIAG